MITVQSTFPLDSAQGIYLNDPVHITFSLPIEGSYLSSQYFMVYRTNEDQSEFYERHSVSITQSDQTVSLTPSVDFDPLSYYLVIVIGGSSGIQDINGNTLTANYLLKFSTGESERVSVPDDSITISGEPSFVVDGDGDVPPLDQMRPSTDLFSPSGESAPIALLSTIPSERSIGVRNLDKLVLVYNDDVESGSLPVNAITGRYTGLPFDQDPFANRELGILGISYYRNQIIVDIEDLTETDNREYLFRVTGGFVRGVNRQAPDIEEHTIRFMGQLIPLYASPEQIRQRMTAWSSELNVSSSDYDLYKLIHEKSLWVRDTLGITMTAANTAQVNRLVVCLVLKEILTMGAVFAGPVKSRSVLLTAVTYDNYDLKDLRSALEDCISESIPDDATGGGVRHGIKSGAHIGRSGKNYGVYR